MPKDFNKNESKMKKKIKRKGVAATSAQYEAVVAQEESMRKANGLIRCGFLSTRFMNIINKEKTEISFSIEVEL